MRVLQINSVNKIYSTGRSTFEMAEWLNNRNIDNYIAASCLGNDDIDFEISSKIDMKIHAVLSRITGKQGYYSKRKTKSLLKYIDGIDPDIVIIGVTHSNIINHILLLNYLKKRRIATIIVMHDFWFATGKCTNPIKSNCKRYLKECHHCPQLKEDNVSWFFDRTKKMFDDKLKLYSDMDKLYFVAVSEWEKEECRNSPLIKNNITTIYNWIDLKKFKNLNIKTDKNKFIILSVATKFDKYKGLDDLLLLSQKLEDDEEIHIVGKISEDVKLPKNIILHETINDPAKLCEIYNYADVYISMSKMETFGKTIAEAICCGTPAIVYKSAGACEELVKDGCGYSVPKGDIEKFYYYIKKIKAEGKNSYSKNCQAKAENEFDYNNNMMKYLELFNHILKDG